MRVLGAIFVSVAVVGGCAPVWAADAPAESGEAKLAAYEVCHPLAFVEMGATGSESSTECNGIVKNIDSQKTPDNLAIHCLEATSARPDAYQYSGACVQTDSDGDKIFMTYGGSKSGQIKWIGGTGKYLGISGAGNLGVVVAPGGSPSLFAYTLTYDIDWTRKPK